MKLKKSDWLWIGGGATAAAAGVGIYALTRKKAAGVTETSGTTPTATSGSATSTESSNGSAATGTSTTTTGTSVSTTASTPAPTSSPGPSGTTVSGTSLPSNLMHPPTCTLASNDALWVDPSTNLISCGLVPMRTRIGSWAAFAGTSFQPVPAPVATSTGVPATPQISNIVTYFLPSGLLANGQRFYNDNVMQMMWPYDASATTFKLYALSLVQKNGVYTFDNPVLALTMSASSVFNRGGTSPSDPNKIITPPFNLGFIPGGLSDSGSLAAPNQTGINLLYGLHFFAMQACNSQGCSGLSPVFFVRTANTLGPNLTPAERESDTLAGYFITNNTPVLLYKTTMGS